jgi:hypothetical protein
VDLVIRVHSIHEVEDDVDLVVDHGVLDALGILEVDFQRFCAILLNILCLLICSN